MGNSKLEQALDILDKFDFFNQRAGRELWNDKPFDVQCQDIEDFANDVKLLREFINQQQEETEKLKDCAAAKCEDCAGCTQWLCDCSNVRDEAITEFARIIRQEIADALENNHTVKIQRIEKLIERGIRSNDDFCHIVDGKILALRGIDVFIENLVKERVGK